MHATLGLEVTVGKVTLHLDRDGLDSCFLSLLDVHHLRSESAALDPALVQAHEHVGPVT